MGQAQEILNQIAQDFDLEQGAKRRELLIFEMQKGHGCQSCVGHCCTYQHNSMQVDPLQCLELLVYLEKNFDEIIWEKIEQTIIDFRLDKFILIGKNEYLRRYYTCPFYQDKNLGCSISRNSKPYACLAFNPLREKVSSEGFCASSQTNLEKRELNYEEKEARANEFLIKELNLYWNKLPMPLALKELRLQICRKYN